MTPHDWLLLGIGIAALVLSWFERKRERRKFNRSFEHNAYRGGRYYR